MGKVPILTTDEGFKIPQSKTIEKYVAKKYGMMGSTDEDAAFIDGLTEHQRDIQDAYNKAKAAEKLDDFFAKDLVEKLTLVEKAVKGKAGPFLYGEKPSLADVAFYVWLCENLDAKEKAKAAYEQVPTFKTMIEAFAAIDAVKAWQAKRPVTPF